MMATHQAPPRFDLSAQEEPDLHMPSHPKVDLQELVRLKNLAGLERATTGQPGDWSLGTAVLPASEPAKVEPKRQICFDFTKHACTRGNACKFSHDINLIIEVNSQERGICFDFLRNTCSRGPLCRFSHDLSNFMPQDAQNPRNRNSPICYDFVKKQCTRGPECRYSHDLDSIINGAHARAGLSMAGQGVGADAALAAVLSGNVPYLPGMGVMPMGPLPGAQPYAASAGLIPAYNPAALAPMAPAVNPHLAAALAQQGNMSPLPYHLPHMLPQAYAQGVIPPAMYGLTSSQQMQLLANAGALSQGRAPHAAWAQQQAQQQQAQVQQQQSQQQQQQQQQQLAQQVQHRQQQVCQPQMSRMPEPSAMELQPHSEWQQAGAQQLTSEALMGPALAHAQSLGAESVTSQHAEPAHAPLSGPATMEDLQASFAQLGMGPDGQLPAALARRATIAGGEGPQAGLPPAHPLRQCSMDQVALAQAAAQAHSRPPSGDVSRMRGPGHGGPPSSLLHHRSMPANLLAETLAQEMGGQPFSGSISHQLSLCQQIWGRGP